MIILNFLRNYRTSFSAQHPTTIPQLLAILQKFFQIVVVVSVVEPPNAVSVSPNDAGNDVSNVGNVSYPL